jgi:hypothetical protein
MGGDFLVFIHLCALQRRDKFSPTGIQSVFTGHLLHVKSWLMSKVSSKQCAAESHKRQDCILFRNSNANEWHFHSKEFISLPMQNNAFISKN